MKTTNFLKLLQREVVRDFNDIDLVAEDGTTVTCKNSYEPSYTATYAFFSPGIVRNDIGTSLDYGIKPSLSLVSNGTNTYMSNGTNRSYWPKLGVIFGDGNTAPAATDYWLSGNMITDFTASSAVTTTNSGGKIVCVGTYSVTNTSASSFTIREIGFTRAASTTSVKFILLMRDVLATPITIAAGATASVEYRVTAG